MSKIEVGVLGGFRGKVGTVVGSRWKGIDTMRHKGRKSTKPRTAAQLDQQAKFAVVTKFVHKLGKLYMRSMADTPEKTGINMAFEFVFKNALIGSYPDYALDFSRIAISKGDLPNALTPVTSATGNGRLKISWEDNSDEVITKADDKCIVVVYCPDMNLALINQGNALRNTTGLEVNTSTFRGKKVHSWITFISAEKVYATSLYTGEVTVS